MIELRTYEDNMWRLAMKRTIKEHLNGERHIQIAQKCMKRLAGLLGCRPDSLKIEGNTSYIDFRKDETLIIPLFPNVGPFGQSVLAIWHTANKIMFA